MQIAVDMAACCGHGACVEILPSVFALDDETGLVSLLAREPAESDWPRVKEAVRECPTDAIEVQE